MKKYREFLNEAADDITRIGKSSWDKLLANKNLIYVDSAYQIRELDTIANLIDRNDAKFKNKANYIGLEGNYHVFEVDDSKQVRVHKNGNVFKYKKYFIVYNESNGNEVIIFKGK